jgi:hypothetical protein
VKLQTTAHQILGNDLNMNRVCARWVPRILTAEHLTKRVELSKQFIKKVNRGGIRFQDRIILMYGNTAELTIWPRGTACVSSIPFLSIKRINIFFPSDLVIFAFFGGRELQFFH